MKLDFLKKEKQSPLKNFESFNEYITPKTMIVMEKYDLGNDEYENEEEKLLREMYSSKKSYHLHDILAITGLSKIVDIKKKILKSSICPDIFLNNRIVNTEQIPFEYLNEIFENLYKEEIRMYAVLKLTEITQSDLNEKIKATIVNWLIQVHFRFKLRDETLFLAIHLLDRFLTVKFIKRRRLQVLAITCLLIACKYEEIFSPEIRDLVCILDKRCSVEDILQAEVEILKVLKFEVTIPSVLRYFEILATKFDFTTEAYLFGKYLLELSLLFWKMRNRLNCLIASSVCYMILKIFYDEDFKLQEKINQFYSLINFKQEEIEECVLNLCFVLDNVKSSNFLSSVRKYMSQEYLEVANNFP